MRETFDAPDASMSHVSVVSLPETLLAPAASMSQLLHIAEARLIFDAPDAVISNSPVVVLISAEDAPESVMSRLLEWAFAMINDAPEAENSTSSALSRGMT